jgi:hypothetical protein
MDNETYVEERPMTHTHETLTQKPKLDADAIEVFIDRESPGVVNEKLVLNQLEALLELVGVLLSALYAIRMETYYDRSSMPVQKQVVEALLAAAPIKHLLKEK